MNRKQQALAARVTVLMELLAQSLAQQAANRDDCSEFVERAANTLEDLTLHAFDRYRGGEDQQQ